MAIMPEGFLERLAEFPGLRGIVGVKQTEFNNVCSVLEELARRSGRRQDYLARALEIDGCRYIFESVDELPNAAQKTVIARVWINLDRDAQQRRKTEGFSPTAEWLWRALRVRRCLLDNLLNHQVFMASSDFCCTCAEQIRKVLQLDLDQVAEKIRAGQKIY